MSKIGGFTLPNLQGGFHLETFLSSFPVLQDIELECFKFSFKPLGVI